MTSLAKKEQFNKHDILTLAYDLGGEKPDHNGWARLPHLCGGQKPGERVGSNPGLAINVNNGGVKCHYGCDNRTARRAVYGDAWGQWETRPQPVAKDRDQDKLKLENSPQPLRNLDSQDARLYLNSIQTPAGGQITYRKASDGQLAKHRRYIKTDGSKSVSNWGLRGAGWTPRIWEPEERIRPFLVITEGEKDAAIGVLRGLTTVAYPGGAGRVQHSDWTGITEYADLHGLEVIICPDTGAAGDKAAAWLAEQHGWAVADMDNIPEGDCPLDQNDWLERLDSRKPGEVRYSYLYTGNTRITDPRVFHDRQDLNRDERPDYSRFRCEDMGWDVREIQHHTGQKSRIPCRCRKCDGCKAYYRWQKGTRFVDGQESNTQSMIHIPGFQTVDALAHYRDLDAHSKRSFYGRKRVTQIIPEDDDTYTLNLIFDGEMAEKQRKLAVSHARRYGYSAEVTVGEIRREQFEDTLPDEPTVARETVGSRGEMTCLTTHFTGWGTTLDDYSNGRSVVKRQTAGEGPLLQAEIPEEIAEWRNGWRNLRDQGDPSWHEAYEAAASHFAEGWIDQYTRTHGPLRRGDLVLPVDMPNWNGPNQLIRDTARYLVGLELWRPAFQHVLEAAGMREYVPEHLQQFRKSTVPEPEWYWGMYEEEFKWTAPWQDEIAA